MEILYKNYTHLCKFLNESIKHSAVNSVNRFTSLMYIAVQFYNQIGWYKGQSVFEKFYCSSDDDFYLICYICYGRPNISITQSFGKWKLYSLYWPAKAKDIKLIWKKKKTFIWIILGCLWLCSVILILSTQWYQSLICIVYNHKDQLNEKKNKKPLETHHRFTSFQ